MKLEASGLAFAYPGGRAALAPTDLRVEPGEFVGLLGPNGAGKSTLLKLLAGVLRPTGGRVRLGGEDLPRLSRRRLARTLSFVPQDLHAWLPFTCREVVAMGRYAHQGGLGLREQGGEVVERCMAETGVTALAERRITEVSGGEAQRVRIAQALAQEGQVLLLDEPTSHLDLSFQVEVMDVLHRLNRERGLTVVVSLHDLNLAALYCRRLVVLQAGHLVADGTPDEVVTEALLRQVFRVEAEVAGGPRVFLRRRRP